MNSSNTSNHKLRFRILECSSEESQYPASELLAGSTQSKGWQSQRFCTYPQYITFQFLTPVHLRQVQFLCHEAKIPSKIEIFMASPEPLSALSHNEPTYKRLGHLELETNEQSNFSLRELKTIFIDKPCLFLKVVFHKCYANRLNFFNQVGLITLVAFGEQIGNYNYPPKNMLNLSNLPNFSAPMSRRDKTEPTTELDEVTMIKISELEEAKLRAVENEEFDEAQRLKAELNRLHELGLIVRRLEEKKAVSIENEDYETAKAYKREIDRCREALTDAINGRRPRTNNYRDPPTQNSFYPPLEKVVPPRNSNADRSMNRTPSYQRPSVTRLDQERSMMRHDESLSVLEEEKRGRGARDAREAYGDSYNYQRKAQANRSMPPSMLNFDEQVIPTHMKKGQGGGAGGVDDQSQEQDIRVHVAEELTTANQKLAAPLLPALGQELCKKLFSKYWDLREEAVQTISIELSNPSSKVINTNDQWSLFVATLGAVSLTITDRVNQVSIKAMNLLKALLAKKPPNPGAKNDFIVYLEVVLNGLLEKISDNNSRIREQAEEAILNMTKNPVFSCPFCLSVILKDNNNKGKGVQPAKNTIARLRLLQKMVSMFKIDNDQIPYTPVIDFCLEKLDNANFEVRATVNSLLVDIYVLVGDRLKNDLTDVRPAQLEILMREFDAVSKSSRSPVHGPVSDQSAQKNTQGKSKK